MLERKSWTCAAVGAVVMVFGATGAFAQATASGLVPPSGYDYVHDWLSWRGPDQNGTSRAIDLPDKIEINGDGFLWSYDLAGRGTPVIDSGHVYMLGYAGTGADLQERLVCLDERSGRVIWEHRVNDYLSDVIYSRYSIGSPTVDGETGHVYWLSSAGDFMCFARDGEMLWQREMVADFGRQTYPNGRTGAPLIEDDLVIVRMMTVLWGPLGPARDRFIAFDKRAGESVWISTPGGRPKDGPYSHPVVEWRDGRRVLYAGTAGGNVVCVDVRTGQPYWRKQLSVGGICASTVLYGDKLIVTHAKENLDTSEVGRTQAIKLTGAIGKGLTSQAVLGNEHEAWRNGVLSFSSSPVLVGDRVYITDMRGELCCINADSGDVLWKEKLDTSQIHASPVAADGKLYVPMVNGQFYVIKPSDDGLTVLSRVEVEGDCLGAPAIANGRIYLQTTRRLYCFGTGRGKVSSTADTSQAVPSPGVASVLLMVPDVINARPGDRIELHARLLDERGTLLETRSSGFVLTIPESLAVATDDNTLRVTDSARPGVGVITANLDGLTDTIRMRIAPGPVFSEDFESFILDKKDPKGMAFALPPGYWFGGPPRWQILEVDGNKVAARTISNSLFQRTMTFLGDARTSNSTISVDIMTDGNRRTMSTGGVVNQRYLFLLKGNHQQLEVSSNMERIKETAPFRWKPATWYRLKTSVQNQSDGSTLVVAKVWPRDEAEPGQWLIEFRHAHGHRRGAPGLYGFTPQSRFRVYLDNLSISPNN